MAIIKIKNQAIDLDAAEIPNLPATKITSGTFDNARISLDAAEIPNLDTAKITTGTLADARIPANALNSNVDLTTLSASNLTSGTLPDARFPSTLPAISGANLTNLPGGGLSEADMWRISANKSSASGSTFTSNWERADTYGYDKLGTGMTESSGIFTFPSTGHYRVSFIGRFTGANIQYAGLMMMVTTDNSTYNQYAKTYTSLDTSGDETFAYVEAFIDVTNTTNVKVKFDQQMAGSDGAWQGNTNNQMTGATFLKLAET
jgi:hypothetical protein